MKEMTTEQKARAYDEALERAKEFYILCKKCGAKDTADFLENTFSELKESEDEKIRKEIIEYLWDMANQTPLVKENLDCRKWISYLEKQGKQPFAIRWYDVSLIPQEMEELLVEWDSEDATWHEIAFYHADTKTFWNGTRQVENVTRWCYIIDLLEKQEQKPADKVEPKFKVGDYIERKDGLGCHAKIIFIGKNVYGCKKLIYPEDSSPFFELMFENQDEFRVSSDFQQKSAWSEEDEKIRKELLKHCTNAVNGVTMCVSTADYARWLAWLEKQGEQKQEWSLQDEKNLDDIFCAIRLDNALSDEKQDRLICWLQQYRPYMHKDQKLVEWSGDDDNMLEAILHTLGKIVRYKNFDGAVISSCENAANWLKSLRQRIVE